MGFYFSLGFYRLFTHYVFGTIKTAANTMGAVFIGFGGSLALHNCLVYCPKWGPNLTQVEQYMR